MDSAVKPRLQWLDVMKGLGIIAVVAGHVADTRFVYVFHMPLFFIISGFLMKAGRYTDAGMLRHNAMRLLVPYFVFLLIFYVPEALHAIRKGQDLPGLELPHGGSMLQGRLTVFWFITVLFLSSWIFNFMLNRGWLSAFLFVGILFAGYVVGYKHVDLPWAAHVVPVAVFYLWIGNRSALLYGKLMAVSWPRIYGWIIAALIIASFVVAWIWRGNLAMDMKVGYYGIPVLSVAFSIWLTFCIAIVSMWICRTRHLGGVLALIGEASLIIMFLHMAIHRTMHTLPWGITIIPAIAIPLLIYVIVKRYPLTSLLFLGIRKTGKASGGKINDSKLK